MRHLLLFFLLFVTGSAMSQPPLELACTDKYKLEPIEYSDFTFYPDQQVGSLQFLKFKGNLLHYFGFPIIEMITTDETDTLLYGIEPKNSTFAGVASDFGNMELCDVLSQMFFVESENIKRFNYDFINNPEKIIDTNYPEIFKWPGRNNPHFKNYNSYHVSLQEFVDYAPFFDYDGDGNYNPIKGDYPKIEGKAMSWTIRTVKPRHSSASEKFPSITYKSSYIFPYDDNSDKNKTAIIYFKSNVTLNKNLGSLRFGLRLDPDLGCNRDDYYGSNHEESYVIINNADNVDGNIRNVCFGGVDAIIGDPPLFLIKNIKALGVDDLKSSENRFFATGMHCDYDSYNFTLRGEAFSGQQYRLNAEDACSGPFDIVTRHSYHGNPADTSSACMINRENFEGEDIRFSIAYDKIENVTADKTYEFVLGLSVIETEYKKRVDFNDTTIINRVRLMDELYEDFPTSTEEFEDIARKDLHVFPNPSNSKIHINARMKSDIEIYNIQGQKVLEINKYTGLPIDISHLNTGLYFLTERNDSGLRSVKFVKGE